MKVTARINGENLKLVEKLNQRGITAKLVKGGVIVELPAIDKNSWNPETYEIPSEVNGGMLFLDLVEEGGGMTHTGSSTVVCGLSGKALRPYYVPRGGHLSCGTHAFFSVPNAVITVEADRQDDNVVIKEHRIVCDDNVARIKGKKIWTGALNELPKIFSHFQKAAEAAIQKANCYHCREPHFFLS